ncbi:MAG: hypothetical protein LLG37_00205 [Spirochaetia bacterium]|nr:hypothetical protein [Spirochaetia bacterium]
MKKSTVLFLIVLLALPYHVLAQDESDMWTMTDDLSFYSSVTASSQYRNTPEFKPLIYDTNDLFQDIKVTAIESVPFGFLLTFIGLWAYRAMEYSTLSPELGTLEENKQLYFISIGTFAALNVIVNAIWFYDYSKDNKEDGTKKEDTGEKITDNPQL